MSRPYQPLLTNWRIAMRHLPLLLLAAVAASPAVGDDAIPAVVGGHTWTEHQLELAKARHPGIAWIRAEGTPDKGKDVVVFGATNAIGSVLKPVPNPDTKLGTSHEGGLEVIHEPFLSNSGHRLGTLAIAFGKASPHNEAIADQVQHEVARNMLSAKNAADPYPYSAAYRDDSYAQKLVDAFTREHPDLLVMMIHATPPGKPATANAIIGSNIGRIGKIADDDDLRVIEKGSTNLEVADTGDRYETELPLLDSKGQRIGALGLVFKLNPGASKDALHAHGIAIRNELAKRIPGSAALFKPSRS